MHQIASRLNLAQSCTMPPQATSPQPTLPLPSPPRDVTPEAENKPNKRKNQNEFVLGQYTSRMLYFRPEARKVTEHILKVNSEVVGFPRFLESRKVLEEHLNFDCPVSSVAPSGA